MYETKSKLFLFLFGLILISLDAYTIFNIPLTWIGQITLFFWVILNFKLIKLPSKKTFLLIFSSYAGIANYFY